MYDNWLFLNFILFPPKKKREEEKENGVANGFFRIQSIFTKSYSMKNQKIRTPL